MYSTTESFTDQMVPTLFDPSKELFDTSKDPIVSDYWLTTILCPEKYAADYEVVVPETTTTPIHSSGSVCVKCIKLVSQTGHSTNQGICSPCKIHLCTRIEQEHDYSSTKPVIKVEPKDDEYLPAKEQIYDEFTSLSPHKLKKGYSWDYFFEDKPIKQEDFESKPVLESPKPQLYADRYVARTRKQVCYNVDKLVKPSLSPERKPKPKRGRPPKHKPTHTQLPHKSHKKSRTMFLPPTQPMLKRERSSKGRKHGVFKSTAKREEHNQMERNRRQALSKHNADLKAVIPKSWFYGTVKGRITGPSRQKVLDTATQYIKKFQKLSILDTGFRDTMLPNILQHMKSLKTKLSPVIKHNLQRLVY